MKQIFRNLLLKTNQFIKLIILVITIIIGLLIGGWAYCSYPSSENIASSSPVPSISIPEASDIASMISREQIVNGLSGSRIFETAIGLVFAFSLISLFVSRLQELIAFVFSMRAKHMLEVVQVLLGSQNDSIEANSPTCEVEGLQKRIKEISSDYVKGFYNSAIIKSLSKPGHYPSFIAPLDFADYVLDHILTAELNDNGQDNTFSEKTTGFRKIEKKDKEGGDNSIENQLKIIDELVQNIAGKTAKEAIMSKIRLAWRANETFEKRVVATRDGLMDLFNTTTDRAEGWYKRDAQNNSFLIAIILCFIFNIDAIGMTWTFYNGPQLRGYVIQEVSTSFIIPEVCKSSPDFATCLSEQAFVIPETCQAKKTENELTLCIMEARSTALLNTLDDLPIGWSSECLKPGRYDPNNWPNSIWTVFWKTLGFLISSFLVSFGAPFWHDLLGKLVNTRMAGKKPNYNKR